MNDTCAAPHRTPVPAEPAAAICQPCRLHLRHDLRQLPALDADLEYVTVTLTRRRGGRGAGGRGLAVNTRVMAARDRLWWLLVLWRNAVASAQRTLPPPSVDVADVAGWLAEEHRIRFVSFRYWAGDMCAEVAGVHSLCWGLLNPLVRARIEIPGRCPECGGGRLVAVVFSDAAAERSFAGCRLCGVRWPPERWQLLAREMREVSV